MTSSWVSATHLVELLLTPNFVKRRFIPSLLYYFKTKNVIEAAIYAGLTVLIAIIPSIMINKILFNEYIPKKINHIIIKIVYLIQILK